MRGWESEECEGVMNVSEWESESIYVPRNLGIYTISRLHNTILEFPWAPMNCKLCLLGKWPLIRYEVDSYHKPISNHLSDSPPT